MKTLLSIFLSLFLLHGQALAITESGSGDAISAVMYGKDSTGALVPLKVDSSGNVDTSGGGNGGGQVMGLYPTGRLVNLQNNSSTMAIISDDDNEYAGLWDASAHLVLCQRALGNRGGIWTCYPYDGTGGRTTITLSGDDYHDSITLGQDETGIIHVTYDQHADALKYRRSTAAQNVSNLTAAQSMLGTNETTVSYSQFFNDINTGQLFHMFRSGGSGLGDEYLYEYTAGTTTWTAATGTGSAGFIYDGDITGTANDTNMYVSGPYIDASNVAHFIYVKAYDEGGVVNNRKELSYFNYNLTSGVFKKTNGSTLTAPWNATNGDIIDAVGFDDGLRDTQNIPSINADSSGAIFAAYNKADDFDQNQVFVAILEAGSWTIKQITSAPSSAEYSPLSVAPASAGDQPPITLVGDDDSVYIIYKHTGEGRGYHVAKSIDQFATWEIHGIYPGDVGTGKISVDVRALYDRQEFNIVFQDHQSTTAIYTVSPVYYFHWAPSDGFCAISASANISQIQDISILSDNGAVIFQEINAFSNSGRLGLGDTSADGTLEVVAAAGVKTFMISSTASSNGDFLMVGSTGNVGINSVNPTQLLEITNADATAYAPSSASTTARIAITNTDTTAGNSAGIAFKCTSSTGTAGTCSGLNGIFIDHTNGSLTGALGFFVRSDAGTIGEAMRIRQDGNVGIGTIEPGAPFQVGNFATGFRATTAGGIVSAGNVGISTTKANPTNVQVTNGIITIWN